MMHEDQMESIVKTRVMGFLKHGGDVAEPRSPRADGGDGAAPEGPVDYQELIRKGVDEEVRRIKAEEEAKAKREQEEAERQTKEAQLSQTVDKLNGELERMRMELEQQETEKRKAAEEAKEKEAEKTMLKEIDELKAQLAEERKAEARAEEKKARGAATTAAVRDETSGLREGLGLREELEELRDIKESLMHQMEGYAAPAPLPSPRRYLAPPAASALPPSPRRYRDMPRDELSPLRPARAERYYERPVALDRPALDRHRPSPAAYRDDESDFVVDYDHDRKVAARPTRLRVGLPPSSPRFGSRGLAASPRMANSPRHEADDDMTYTRQVMSPRHRPLSRSRGVAGRYSFGSRFE